MITFGSLFSGIGGIDLGFERAGLSCSWQVEIDDYCNRVLEKHWPDVRRYRDVKEVGSNNLEPVDVIVGGFPCQPHSVAGKRKGAADDRNLWPEYLRIVKELQPTFVIGENVPGIITTYLDTVISDLESAGYEVAIAEGVRERGQKLWRTPQAWNAKQGPKSKEKYERSLETNESMITLVDQVRHEPSALYPTPTSRDHKDTGDLSKVPENSLLPRVVQRMEREMWPTPNARDYKGSPSDKHKAYSLPREVKKKEATGSLNPTWVEWLMGFPIGWTDLKD